MTSNPWDTCQPGDTIDSETGQVLCGVRHNTDTHYLTCVRHNGHTGQHVDALWGSDYETVRGVWPNQQTVTPEQVGRALLDALESDPLLADRLPARVRRLIDLGQRILDEGADQ